MWWALRGLPMLSNPSVLGNFFFLSAKAIIFCLRVYKVVFLLKRSVFLYRLGMTQRKREILVFTFNIRFLMLLCGKAFCVIKKRGELRFSV